MLKPNPHLLAHVLGTPRETIMPWKDYDLTKAQQEKLAALHIRLNQGEPLSKIIGEREFWSRPFKVTHDTLDPRPDSETLIEACLKYYEVLPKPVNILELGVGTGCLLITLLLEFKKLADRQLHIGGKSLGIDVSEKALAVAKENAKTYGIDENTCAWRHSNWFEYMPKQQFSLIISNPPYIEKEYPLEDNVRLFDPHLALFGGEDGLGAYNAIAKDAKLFLKQDGLFICEIGIGQKQSVTEIFKRHGFHLRQVFKDLSKIDRCLVFA